FRPILQLGSGFVRGTPLLLQLFFLYFGLSPLLPKYALCQWLTTPFMIALLTLSLNSAAYTYHALWGTFTQLPHHQIKAGEVLGFSPSNLFWKILLPQGLWQFWPLYRFEAIFILKSTALVSSITLLDITGLAKLWLSQAY